MNTCANCKKETKNPKYCSRSCSATITGSKYPKRIKALKYTCIVCKTKTSNNKYCSSACFGVSQRDGYTFDEKLKAFNQVCTQCDKPIVERYIKKFCSVSCSTDFHHLRAINNGTAGIVTYRNFLIKANGKQCSICKNIEWMGQEMPIELDHINGDSTDNSLQNLRLICPNCHSQTTTYKGKNKGNGRAKRRQRYAEGKSY